MRLASSVLRDGLRLANALGMPGSAQRPEHVLSVARLDGDLIERLYAQCASFYDWLCGPILQAGRREAMRELALQAGDKVLEIGFGTGLTAPLYPADCNVTGIDVSAPMLREAEKNLAAKSPRNIQLFRMDAANLRFSDQSFDVVYAAYVISVVPDPIAVLAEMRRVCRVGGHIVLLNHFLSDSSFLSKFERLISHFASARLGFRTDLDVRLLLAQANLQLVSMRKVNTPRIWTLLHCRRDS
jgi:phosphatidylethanolamine/phosphatidyl-N-methylethanolamine N-methyltransferase